MSFESFENPLNEEVVVGILDAHPAEAPEAIEVMGQYADQCHREADYEAASDAENPAASNRANIKAELKIAKVYSRSVHYKELGVESLEQVLMTAIQDPSTEDLAQEIEAVLEG